MSANWQPKNQLQRGIKPGEWYVFDGHRKISIILLITMRSGRKVLRAVTWDADPSKRALIAYVGENDLKLLVEIVWSEWTREHPSVSNRM